MSLTSVGKLLNKVVRIPNGREKMRNISVSYGCQFKMLLELQFVVFLP